MIKNGVSELNGVSMRNLVRIMGAQQKKTPHRLSERGFKLAPQAGLEPATQWLTATCSTN